MACRGITICPVRFYITMIRKMLIVTFLFLLEFDGGAGVKGMHPSDVLRSYDSSPSHSSLPSHSYLHSPSSLSSSSSSTTSQLSSPPSATSLSSASSHPSASASGGESWTEEDDDWWEGAEEIDLTFDKPSPLDIEEAHQEVDQIFFDESSFLDMDCDDFLTLASPPSLVQVPPPPLPAFLVGMGEILEESYDRWKTTRNSPHFPPIQHREDLLKMKLDWVSIEDDDTCSICDWALGGNETIDLLTKKRANPNAKVSNWMVIVVVGVALISAAIGATVMGMLLKCKKGKNFLPCGAGENCFRSPNRRVHSQSQELPARNNKSATASSGTSGILPGFAMKLWRRGSSQAPLNPCSTPGSENSYSEEPYINADATSAAYAELNSVNAPGGPVVRLNPSPLSSVPYSNTYSEIPSPVHSADICSRMCPHHHEGTYENSGYLLSESPSDPTESSTGSNSTPSSAYYSDVSSSDVYTNKKKKKKRKGADDRPPCSVPSSYPIIGGSLSPVIQGVPVICSHVTHQPVHLNFSAAKSQYLPSADNNMPVTLQLLPRQMEQRIPEVAKLAPHQTGMLIHSKNLTHRNIVHQNPQLLLNIRNHRYDPSQPTLVSPQSQISSGHCGSGRRHLENNSSVQTCPINSSSVHLSTPLEAQEELVLMQYNGKVLQRPLPPLPSRQPSDPRRRNLKMAMGANVPNIPSEV